MELTYQIETNDDTHPGVTAEIMAKIAAILENTPGVVIWSVEEFESDEDDED